MIHRAVPSVQALAVLLMALLTVLLVPAASAAQTERGGIRLGFGLVRHGQTDLMASPLRYRGSAALVAVGYRRVHREMRLGLAASFAALTLESRISGTGSRERLFLTALRVRWLRRVAERGVWEAFLGARVDVTFPLRRHEYLHDLSELFGDVFVPLQLAGVHELRLSPAVVAWQAMALPLAAVVLRSPYAGLKYAPDPELVPPGRLLGLDHVVGADWAPGGPWSLRAEWRTSLLRYPDPRELSMVTHRLALGLEVRP